jgi:phosphatidylglycerophosphatase A
MTITTMAGIRMTMVINIHKQKILRPPVALPGAKLLKSLTNGLGEVPGWSYFKTHLSRFLKSGPPEGPPEAEEREKMMNALTDNQIVFLATGCNVGKIKYAPGTFGTLVGIPLFLVLSFFNGEGLLPYQSLMIVAFVIFAIWVADRAVTILATPDPGCVVIDEIAGFLVTMTGLDFTLKNVILGFLIFRFFDILKPFPVKNLEDGVSGGAGVVADDVAAGIMAAVLLRIILAVFS